MSKKPHIILLVLDTLRAQRMSLYGHDKETTPVLSEFASQSTVFDRAIAPAPWTVPSHASMFTGLYPTVHQTTQSYATLPDDIPTLAEKLREQGYHNAGFCNNPLVSVLDNGLKRGFDDFYNYSGTFPDIPEVGDTRAIVRFKRRLTRMLQQISAPIEKQVSDNPLFLKMAMMPFIVPIWTRLGKFKGDTRRSLKDVTQYLKYRTSQYPDTPTFTFINMMETHLPYYPPRKVLDKWAPYLKKDREASDFLAKFNTESYRWVAPMLDPFTEMQERVLRDAYDAEIAYQDQQLRRVFRFLERSGELENTMVMVVSDHGESHGDHDFMGHAFVNYDEVVHVPLMVHYPAAFPAGHRVEHNVSVRRVFHTALTAAGVEHESYGHPVEDLSLAQSAQGQAAEPEDEHVLAEAFPVMNFVNVMEMNHPEAIERFRVKKLRRAYFDGHLKMQTVGDQPDEFFDLAEDPGEQNNLLDNPFGYENDVIRLENELTDLVTVMEGQRDGIMAGDQIDYSNNPELLDRLRGLGYIE